MNERRDIVESLRALEDAARRTGQVVNTLGLPALSVREFDEEYRRLMAKIRRSALPPRPPLRP